MTWSSNGGVGDDDDDDDDDNEAASARWCAMRSPKDCVIWPWYTEVDWQRLLFTILDGYKDEKSTVVAAH